MLEKVGQKAYLLYLQKIKRISLARDLIRYSIKKNYSATALVDKGRQVTYGQLYERAKKLADAFFKLGVNKEDKLAVLLYNCREYFEIRIAAYLAGIVLVPIIWDAEERDIIFILNDYKVKALIYHSGIWDKKIKKVKNESKANYFIEVSPNSAAFSSIPCSATSSLPVQRSISYQNLISGGESFETKVKLKETGLASINFSSGTTGRLKGVMLLQKSWMNSFYNYLANSSKAKKDKLTALHILSFSTAGGTIFLPALYAGYKNIIMPGFNTEEAISLILKYKINILMSSPTLLASIVDYCKARQIKLNLDSIIVGTEPVPQARLMEAIDFFGPVIQQGYGMVEVLPPLSLLSARDYLMPGGKINKKRIKSCGRPLKGIKIKILDKKGREVFSEKKGRIIIKSSSMSLGYYNNQDLTLNHYKDGWFYTNDYGYIDKDGYLYVLGRKEDILEESSEDIFFTCQIEEILHSHPSVLEACVFSFNRKVYGFIALKEKSLKVTFEEISQFCKSALGKDIFEKIDIFDRLPKNASGKLNRKKIKENFLKKYKI